MSSAAQLANLLGVTADLNYYTMQLNYWASKYEANAKKLQKQVSYEEKWENACDSAIGNTRKLSCGCVEVPENNPDTDLAEDYADQKVSEYDEALSLELAELDIEYDAQKTMYEALVTMLKAQKDEDKQNTASSLQDTHTLQS